MIVIKATVKMGHWVRYCSPQVAKAKTPLDNKSIYTPSPLLLDVSADVIHIHIISKTNDISIFILSCEDSVPIIGLSDIVI